MLHLWITLMGFVLPMPLSFPTTSLLNDPQTDWTVTYADQDGASVSHPNIITDHQGHTFLAMGSRRVQDGEIRLVKLDNQGKVIWEVLHDEALSADLPGTLVLFRNGDVGLVSVITGRFKIGRYRADGSPVYRKEIPFSNGLIQRPPLAKLDSHERLIIAAPGGKGVSVAAIAQNGDALWQKSQASGEFTSVIEMILDSQDRIYITGIGGPVDFVFSLHTDGQLRWAAEEFGIFGSPLGDSHIALDSQDQVVMLVTQENECGVPNPIIRKFDAEGNTLWRHSFRENHCPGRQTGGLAVNDQDHAIALTYGQNDDQAGNAIFVTQFDENGLQTWELSHHEGNLVNLASHLALDPLGGGVVLGRFSLAAQETDMLVFRFSATGEKIWTARVAQPGNIWDTGFHRNPAGHITIAGHGQLVGMTSDITLARFRDPCPGDFDLNQAINHLDLLAMLPQWDTFGLGATLAPPMDQLDIHDLLHLINQQGACP